MKIESLAGQILERALFLAGCSSNLFDFSKLQAHLVIRDPEGDLWFPFEEAVNQVDLAIAYSLETEREEIRSEILERTIEDLIQRLVEMRDSTTLRER